MATDEARFVMTPTPVDVTGVRDSGMQSLIILAASLGWNVHKKHNQPVVVTARNGVQKRLATNTSIRMGVFQSALSTIMAHTDEEVSATPELMDAIIAITKPPADHQRRLRLAVGESPAQHRERVAALETEPKGPREPQPLTQRMRITMDDELLDLDEVEKEDAAPAADRVSATRVPADGEWHGELVSRAPTIAKRSKFGEKSTYVSDTSFERHWEDDYIDFECMVCGMAFASSRGVGGHSQIHMERKAPRARPWQRSQTYVPGTLAEWSEPNPGDTATVLQAEPVDDQGGAMYVLGQIIDLVAPPDQGGDPAACRGRRPDRRAGQTAQGLGGLARPHRWVTYGDQDHPSLRRVPRNHPRHPALLVGDQRRQPPSQLPITACCNQGEAMNICCICQADGVLEALGQWYCVDHADTGLVDVAVFVAGLRGWDADDTELAIANWIAS